MKDKTITVIEYVVYGLGIATWAVLLASMLAS